MKHYGCIYICIHMLQFFVVIRKAAAFSWCDVVIIMHNMDGLVSANDGVVLTSRWLMAARRLDAAHSKSRLYKKKRKKKKKRRQNSFVSSGLCFFLTFSQFFDKICFHFLRWTLNKMGETIKRLNWASLRFFWRQLGWKIKVMSLLLFEWVFLWLLWSHHTAWKQSKGKTRSK